MQGTIQSYVLCMADEIKKEPLKVKQYDTNSRWAKITLKAFNGEYWLVPFDVQIYINVHKADGTLATATCTKVDEHTVLAPITEQMTAVTGTQQAELYFLAGDGDIKSQTFPIAVYPMIMDQVRIESSDDFQSLQGALRQVETSTEMADAATQYATAQGDQARDAAQRAEDAADSIQAAVDAAANAKACESNAKNSELAAVQTQQEVTDYVEAQKAAFVGYSQRESDSKYANALTATTTGEGGVTLEDAWTAPVLGLDVVGKSEQVVTTGAQLQPFGDDTITHVGVTLTINNDLVSLLGTATYSGGRNTLKLPDVTLQAGSYTISMSDTINIVMAVTDDANSVLVQGANIKELKFNIVKETSIHIGFNVISGNVYNITGLRIMLNAGDSALPWEPYTGGAPSPSPDYPQDIISVGTVSTGKQLIDASRIPSKTAGGATLTNNGDGSFTITGNGELSANFSTYYTLTHEESQHIFPPGKYSISTKSTPVTYINFKNTDGIVASLTYKSGTKEITEEMVNDDGYYVNIGFMGETGQAITPKTIFPMLNAGDTALPWEPYTGGKPSPSVEYPQVVEVTATGAQLFYKSLVMLQGTGAEADITDKRAIKITYTRANGGKYAGFIVDDKINIIGKTLTISYSGIVSSKSGLTPGIRLYWIDNNGFVLSYVVYVNKSPTTITIEDPQNDMATKLALLLYADIGDAAAVNDYVIYKDIMINAGDTALPWEPYKGRQTVPITLTEPLRGIGEYRDRIMCRDGVWGIERYWKSTVLDGKENVNILTNTGKCNRFVISIPDKNETLNQVFSDVYRYAVGFGTTAGNIDSYENCIAGYNTTIRVCVALADVESFKTQLEQKLVTILYPLATPTWEPLPTATQQALNALTTYAGTTHLTITAGGTPAEVTLDYVQDTQKAIEQHDTANRQYTDNQIAAIVAALPTAMQAAIVDNQTTKLLQEV